MDGQSDKDLDAEIDSFLAGGNGAASADAPADTQGADPAQTPDSEAAGAQHRGTASSEGEEYEIGGRKYTLDGLKTTVGNQLSHISKLEREIAQQKKWSEPWRKLESAWKSDPERYQHLKKANDEYERLRSEGVPKERAKAEAGLSGVPKEVMEKLSRVDVHDKYFEESKLNQEISEFERQNKVDKPTMNKVLRLMYEYADEGMDLPMHRAYQMVRTESVAQDAKKAEMQLSRVKTEAGVGSGQAANVKTPQKRVEDMTEKEYDEFLNQYSSQHEVKF